MKELDPNVLALDLPPDRTRSLSSAQIAARLMLIARDLDDGWVLSSQDYKAGEMITHAQSCMWIVGWSRLADALNEGIDVHAKFACQMLGIELEDFNKNILLHKNLRQAAKVPNFSKAGGGGDATMVLQYRKQGEDTPFEGGPSMIDDGEGNLIPGFKGARFCTLMRGTYCGIDERGRKNKTMVWPLEGDRQRKIKPTCRACLECMAELSRTWKQTWPENITYRKYVSSCIDNGMVIEPQHLELWPWWQDVFQPNQQLDRMQIAQHWSGRLRKVGSEKENPFCVVSNGFFQALLSDISKLAYRICSRECYDRTYRVPTQLFWNSVPSPYAGMQSPLFGSRLPIFAHDELLGEHPRSMGHDASTRIAHVMLDVMRYVCPDLAQAAEVKPTLMAAWDKRAEMVVHNDRVVPWTREHNSKQCGECAAQKQRDDARKAAA